MGEKLAGSMFAVDQMEWWELVSLYGKTLANTIWCKLHPGVSDVAYLSLRTADPSYLTRASSIV